MIVDKLNDIINSYNEKDSLMSLCVYVKENIRIVPQMSIDELAQKTYLSKGQISKSIRLLGYQNFSEFKYACQNYNDSLLRKKRLFNKEKSVKQNCNDVTNKYCHCIQYTSNKLDYFVFNQLTKEIIAHPRIYVYAHGDARGNCYNLQRELKYIGISVMIIDEDFSKKYQFCDDDLLIVLSTNGQIFEYNQRILLKIKKLKISKWLITCHEKVIFEGKQLIIPSDNKNYNEYVMKYLIDMLILNSQLYF